MRNTISRKVKISIFKNACRKFFLHAVFLVMSVSREKYIVNAAEIWQKETSKPSIATFSQNLDNVLGNDGIQLGTITELIGLPGAGKTQLCLQLCAAVQIPKSLGGLEAEALYIDTNTNFTLDRFKEIALASTSKCHRILDQQTDIYENEVLNKLHYVNAFGLVPFCAYMHRLPKFIKDHPNIRLIVIDSISFPFKEGISVKQRTGMLFRQMADLQRVAVEEDIAIVVTNEMSTRIGLSGGAMVGSLGDAWAHRCNTRLLISNNGRTRLALVLKSNNAQNVVAEFQITHEGIRDTNETHN